MGFTTRGCIRKCPFCLVSKKEGMIHDHADIQEFLGGRKKVILLDNNIVASNHGIRQLEYCRDYGISIDCNQGMDARIICRSEYLQKLISSQRILGSSGIRIACDQKSEIDPCHTTIRRILELNPKARFTVYCILTDDYDDSVNRVLQWKQYGHSVSVYAPPYRNFDDPDQVIPRWQKDLSRWASNHYIYYISDWENYNKADSHEEQQETLF